MATALLTTKLHMPALRPGLVERPRLIEKLNRGLERGCPLTLVSAPAGYGKTTLIAQWLQALDRPVAWLSVDAADDDLVRFLSYLVASLQTVDAGIGQTTQSALQVPRTPAPESLMTALLTDLHERSRPLLLAVDDYHLLRDPQIHEALEILLERAPRDLHVVLLCREDPPLALPRHRLHDRMTEIRQRDLAFTRDEAEAYLAGARGSETTAEMTLALRERTEGWIVGLKAAALSLEGGRDVDRVASSFGGEDRHVLDYLLGEVVVRQPPEVRRFLLHTSILERFNASLCEAVLADGDADPEPGGPQVMLERLDAANLFVVPLDNRREWYRYHHLFGDTLRSRLRREHPGLERELHRRASAWYETAGDLDEALVQALAVPDASLAAEIAERHLLRLARRSQLATCRRWIRQLSEAEMCTRPYLAASVAWIQVLSGEVDAAERYVAPGEACLADYEPVRLGHDGRLVTAEEVQGELTAVRAYGARLRRRFDQGIELSEWALTQLPKDAASPRSAVHYNLAMLYWSWAWPKEWEVDLSAAIELAYSSGENSHALVHALSIRAEAEADFGRFGAAEKDLTWALAVASASGTQVSPIACHAHFGMAELYSKRCQLPDVLRHVSRGLALAQPADLRDEIALGLALKAGHAWRLGDFAGAEALVREADGLVTGRDVDVTLLQPLNYFRAQIRLAQGDIDGAAERFEALGWCETGLLNAGSDLARTPVWAGACQLVAYWRMARGNYDAALALIDNLIDSWATTREFTSGRFIRRLVQRALALHGKGDVAAALAVLEEALDHAGPEPEWYMSSFLLCGASMAKLVRHALMKGIHPVFLRKVHDALAEVADKYIGLGTPPDTPLVPTPDLPEPLSERERQVLRLLSVGLSAREIAAQLIVSYNTARTHIQTIYRKLDVHSRDQAIDRAEQLGLL